MIVQIIYNVTKLDKLLDIKYNSLTSGRTEDNIFITKNWMSPLKNTGFVHQQKVFTKVIGKIVNFLLFVVEF